jgi:hypothetical protein
MVLNGRPLLRRSRLYQSCSAMEEEKKKKILYATVASFHIFAVHYSLTLFPIER